MSNVHDVEYDHVESSTVAIYNCSLSVTALVIIGGRLSYSIINNEKKRKN